MNRNYFYSTACIVCSWHHDSTCRYDGDEYAWRQRKCCGGVLGRMNIHESLGLGVKIRNISSFSSMSIPLESLLMNRNRNRNHAVFLPKRLSCFGDKRH